MKVAEMPEYDPNWELYNIVKGEETTIFSYIEKDGKRFLTIKQGINEVKLDFAQLEIIPDLQKRWKINNIINPTRKPYDRP